jgi:RecA-family ATPase
VSADPLAIALAYIARGWAPVPVPHRSKNPGFDGWQKLRITAETASEHFNGMQQNIGVLLGAASGGLQDVDLDCPEALAVAPHFLPDTPATFGRKGAPGAHWLYKIVDGARGTKPYVDPDIEDKNEAMLVELRGTGGHTIFPGSAHADTGELIEWSEAGEPASIKYEELQRAVAHVAVGALLARHWQKGARDFLCAATVGVLLRAGWDNDDIEVMLDAIAEAADDEKIDGRKEKIARLREQLHVEGAVPGYPKLAELTSDKVAQAIGKWLLPVKDEKKKQQEPVDSHLHIDCAASIVTRSVEWLVPKTFAIGKTSIIAGDPGVAKSTITLDLVASVTNVPKFPWGGCVQGSVLILSAEDDPEDTIVPRLKVGGADLTKVHIIRSVFSIGEDDRPHRRQFNLKNDLELLEQALVKTPGIVLIIIDPISAYLSGTDSHSNAEVREVLAPVAEFAGRTRCAVVVVSHLNKGSSGNNSPIYRIMGSLGFVAAVRSVMMVTKDREDDEGKRRLFMSVKNNNAAEPEGALAYRVEDQDGQPRIAWELERVDITAQEALDATKSDHDAAVDTWVLGELAAGRNRSKELFAAAKNLGFSANKMKSCKRRLRIDPRRVERPETGEKPYWIWALPVKGDGSEM